MCVWHTVCVYVRGYVHPLTRSLTNSSNKHYTNAGPSKTLFLVATYLIGKERVLARVSEVCVGLSAYTYPCPLFLVFCVSCFLLCVVYYGAPVVSPKVETGWESLWLGGRSNS